MNGRVYDPLIARFMTADPNIQSAADLQSYNRYTYVLNNPMMYTDPSGYFSLGSLFRVAAAVAVAYVTYGAVSNAFLAAAGEAAATSATLSASTAFANASIAFEAGTLTTAGMAVSGAAAGFTSSLVASGGDIHSAVQGALSGGISGGLNGMFGQSWSIEHAATYTASGGLISIVNGGSFSSGVREAFVNVLWRTGFQGMSSHTDMLKMRACDTGLQACMYDASGSVRTDGLRASIGSVKGWQEQYPFLARIAGAGMGEEGSVHLYDRWPVIAHAVNLVSKVHDFFNAWNYNQNGLRVEGGPWSGSSAFGTATFEAGFNVYSLATMPVAAAVTARSLRADYIVVSPRPRN